MNVMRIKLSAWKAHAEMKLPALLATVTKVSLEHYANVISKLANQVLVIITRFASDLICHRSL